MVVIFGSFCLGEYKLFTLCQGSRTECNTQSSCIQDPDSKGFLLDSLYLVSFERLVPCELSRVMLALEVGPNFQERQCFHLMQV